MDAEPPLWGLIDRREAVVYLIAHAVVIVAMFGLNRAGVFKELYASVAEDGGRTAVLLLSFVIAALSWLAAFSLFVAARGLAGATPAAIAGPGGATAMTTRGFEIAAYVLAHVIGFIALAVLNWLVLSSVYISLYKNGHAEWGPSIGLAVSAIFTLIDFALFCVFRPAFQGRRD